MPWSTRATLPRFAWRQIVVLWAVAVLFYGVALLTLRLRYWLPSLFGLFLGVVFCVANGLQWAWFYFGWNQEVIFVSYIAAFAGLGAVLIAGTYFRWLSLEIT